MEESAEQILSTLAVIHRFMSAHTSVQEHNNQGSSNNINAEFRARAISECEPPNPNLLQVGPRTRTLSVTLLIIYFIHFTIFYYIHVDIGLFLIKWYYKDDLKKKHFFCRDFRETNPMSIQFLYNLSSFK